MPIPILDETISYGRTAWGLISYLWRWAHRNKRVLTPRQKLELRAKWKPQVESWLLNQNHKKLRHDCIIRDMKRMDTYPEHKEGKGISSWFRASLIDTYERGIMLGLQWENLIEEGGKWFVGESEKMATLLLTGYIPYENIEHIDWTGDQFYPYPHIYCYFDFKRQPYERLGYCEKRSLDEHVYYTEVIDFESVEQAAGRRAWFKSPL